MGWVLFLSQRSQGIPKKQRDSCTLRYELRAFQMDDFEQKGRGSCGVATEQQSLACRNRSWTE